MLPVIKNNTKATYLDIWKIIFMNESVLKECKNSLMIPQLLLINPSSMPGSRECFLVCHVLKQTKLKDALKSRPSRTNLDELL